MSNGTLYCFIDCLTSVKWFWNHSSICLHPHSLQLVWSQWPLLRLNMTFLRYVQSSHKIEIYLWIQYLHSVWGFQLTTYCNNLILHHADLNKIVLNQQTMIFGWKTWGQQHRFSLTSGISSHTAPKVFRSRNSVVVPILSVSPVPPTTSIPVRPLASLIIAHPCCRLASHWN